MKHVRCFSRVLYLDKWVLEKGVNGVTLKIGCMVLMSRTQMACKDSLEEVSFPLLNLSPASCWRVGGDCALRSLYLALVPDCLPLGLRKWKNRPGLRNLNFLSWPPPPPRALVSLLLLGRGGGLLCHCRRGWGRWIWQCFYFLVPSSCHMGSPAVPLSWFLPHPSPTLHLLQHFSPPLLSFQHALLFLRTELTLLHSPPAHALASPRNLPVLGDEQTQGAWLLLSSWEPAFSSSPGTPVLQGGGVFQRNPVSSALGFLIMRRTQSQIKRQMLGYFVESFTFVSGSKDSLTKETTSHRQ